MRSSTIGTTLLAALFAAASADGATRRAAKDLAPSDDQIATERDDSRAPATRDRSSRRDLAQDTVERSDLLRPGSEAEGRERLAVRDAQRRAPPGRDTRSGAQPTAVGESVEARSYASPNLVMVAMDWPAGKGRGDFLGFAISRSPGLDGEAKSFLPNRIDFNGASPDHLPSSDQAPIQKFMWFDTHFAPEDVGKQFTYEITPVTGKPGAVQLETAAVKSLKVELPGHLQDGIGTYFDRALVSSQEFARQFEPAQGKDPSEALEWLDNGLGNAIGDFIRGSEGLEGVIYHLTDPRWVLPALETVADKTSLVYNQTSRDAANADSVRDLEAKGAETAPRTKAAIMHDKFLVRTAHGQPTAVLTGTANFTLEGLTTQANVVHTVASPELAKLYSERKQILEKDPTLGQTSKQFTGWSDPIAVGGAQVRVIFAPEPKDSRVATDTVIESVKAAKSSVVFALFNPTDKPLLESLLAAGDEGKMMFGLVNRVSQPKAGAKENASTDAQMTIYHRSREHQDVFGHDLFRAGNVPSGFVPEPADFQVAKSTSMGEGKFVPEVYVHLKVVGVDLDTAHPIIYVGSANMSNNSLHRNDENLLEIKPPPGLGQHYLAEVLRLVDHYRARAIWNQTEHPGDLKLTSDATWAEKAFTAGTPEARGREALVRPLEEEELQVSAERAVSKANSRAKPVRAHRTANSAGRRRAANG